jgi:hypothetical protein
VYTGKDQGEAAEAEEDERHPIMWLSAEPLRQLKWFYKYPVEKNNPGAKPVVRSFLIPLELWTSISREAVSEDDARAHPDKPFNVDTAYGSNQFGVRGPLLEEIRQQASAGSLISYVGNKSHSLPGLGGDVRRVKELHEDLGAPTAVAPTPIWVDPELGKFVRTKHQGGIANELSFYNAVWQGNEWLMPDDMRRIPRPRRHEMLRRFLEENGLTLPEEYTLR